MNSKTINRAISIAMALCPTNREMRTSHVAFLVRSGKIRNIGINKCKTHPSSLLYPYPSYRLAALHAELDVCLKSGVEDLSDFEMIVLRVDRENKLANSRPCVGCRGVIKQFGIKNVFYSDQEGDVVKL